MYSLVMMMALTTGGDAPAFCGRGCGCGCWGCGCGCYSCGCRGCHKGCGCGCWGCGCGCYSCGCGCYSCGCGCGCYSCGCGCYSCGCYGVVPHHAPAAPKKEEEKKEAAAASATIVVNLPANAKLSIDDQATKQTSAVRTFATPSLENGKEFAYTLKAELVRDGQTLTATKTVTVRAGQQSRVSIEFPETSVAAK
ncbi:MAG: TIGR03000 domain-containing protein [Gemmataceae bacterium]